MRQGHKTVRAACHGFRNDFCHVLGDKADFAPAVLLVGAWGELKERLETAVKRPDVGLQAYIGK